MHVLSDEYQCKLAQGVVSIVENAIKARSKYDNKQLGLLLLTSTNKTPLEETDTRLAFIKTC